VSGFPDYLDIWMRVEDEFPIAILAQVGTDVPNADARTFLYVPLVATDGTMSIHVPFGGPSAGVRIALQALDAAGHSSAWSTSDVVPVAADEYARFPPDATATPPSSVSSLAPSHQAAGRPSAPRSACSR
jgi:hypothetical protein